MTVPHWIIGFAGLFALAAFVIFAFRQGMKVRRSGNDHISGASNYLGGESHGLSGASN